MCVYGRPWGIIVLRISLCVLVFLFAFGPAADAQPYDRSAARAELCIRVEDKLSNVNKEINRTFSSSDLTTMRNCGVYAALTRSGRIAGQKLSDLTACYNLACNVSDWGRNCFRKADLIRQSMEYWNQQEDFNCPR